MQERNVAGRLYESRERKLPARFLLLVLMACSAIAVAQPAGAEDPQLAIWRQEAQAFCTPTPPADITIDLASDSSAQEIERSLRDGAFTVAFINANPFAFRYRVDEEIKLIGEPDLANWFLAKIPVPEAPKAPVVPNDTAKILMAPPVGGGPSCIVRLDTAAKAAADAAVKAESELKSVAAAVTAYDGNLRAARADFDARLNSARGARSCVDVVALARHAATVILPPEELPDHHRSEQAIDAFRDTIGALAGEIEQCPSSFFEASLAGFRAAHRESSEGLGTAKEQIRLLGEHREALRKAKLEIDSILAQQSRFHWTRKYDFARAREVSLSVFRATPDQKEFPTKPQHTLAVEAGRQRFLLAPGMLISALDPIHFTRAQGFSQNEDGSFVLGSDGNRILTPVIVREEESEERLAPMLALHTYLGSIGNRRRGWYITLGVGENWAKEGLDAELLGGLTWEVVPRQGFLTLGALNGVVEHLRSGFWEGRALPEELGEAVPVRKDREWGVALGFTWKTSAAAAAAKPESKP